MLPIAQHMPMVKPAGAGCSGQTAALPSRQPLAFLGPMSEGQPPLESKVMGEGRGAGRGVKGGMTRAEAAAAARSDLVRQWPRDMRAHELFLDAYKAAAARLANTTADAESRAAAARMLTYPLPRRVTPAVIREVTAGIARSLKSKLAAGKRAEEGLDAVDVEVTGLYDSCLNLIDAAHSAGLAVLALGNGPGMAAGHAWCTEFVEVCAGVQGAFVMAKAMDAPRPASVDRVTASLIGERHTYFQKTACQSVADVEHAP